MYEDVVNNHWPVCKCYPVRCPNECRVSPERQNVETHVSTVCPLTVVNCDFHYAGCEVKLVRKDMPAHLAESLAAHISLLALHNQQLAHLTSELKKENEILKQKVNKDVEQQVAELKESLKLKIQELEREKQAQAIINAESRCEIEALKHKVNNDLEQEVAELRRHTPTNTPLLSFRNDDIMCNPIQKEKSRVYKPSPLLTKSTASPRPPKLISL